jgi:hypothetical protein
MFLLAALSSLASGLPVDVHAGENALTALTVNERQGSADLQWHDAEDVVRGTITPFPVRAGAPFTVSVFIGPIQGEAFTGPVTLSVRPLAALGGTDAVTVQPKPGERAWVHAFTADAQGPHRVELAFRTTHLKVVRGELEVHEAPLPRWLSYAVGGGLIAVAITIGVWLTVGRRQEGRGVT